MAVNDVELQAYLSGVWTDVPLMATSVKVTRGIDSYGTWPRPSKVECEIDNDTLDYDPSRPQSLLYGIAGRNTQVRIRPNGSTYLWAEASSWRPERTPEHVPGQQIGRSATQLTAEGLLRRIGTWSDPLRSPMYRTISGRTTSIGHWSLEEDRDALVLANSSGGPSGLFTGITLGEDEAPLGAAQTAKISATSQMSGRFSNASTTAGWQVGFAMKLPALPPSATYVEIFRWTTSNGYTWVWSVNDNTYKLQVLDDDGTSLFSNNVGFGSTGDPTQWITFAVAAAQNGGNVDFDEFWYAQGASVSTGVSDSFAGTVGAIRTWAQRGNATTADGHFAHIFGVTTGVDNLLSAEAISVFNGYLGETAGARFSRLCTELGIVKYKIGSNDDTQRMGPQRPATFLDLLKEIRETDDCRIDDERFDIALTMTTRRALYNQTAALELTYPDDIYTSTKEIGDLNTHNKVTVKNASGGEFTVAQTTGPMSILSPPNGVGLNPFTVDVSVDDENDLEGIANWHLAKGTLEDPLYSDITINLTASPSLRAAAILVREGNYITVTGLEAETIHLLVVGIVRQTTPGVETITFQCEPYAPYMIGIWDDPSFRYDSRTSTLNAGYSNSATSMVVTFTDRNDAWSTTAEPYDWMVGGERITVTSMGAVTGSGPWTQTATVTRAVNGVSKAQTAGTAVHLADAKRWGL